MGLLQVSQLLASREVLWHAAARGARARTVGFNHWMVRKVVDVAAIPNAGRLITPAFDHIDQNLRNAVGGTPGHAWDFALRTAPASQQAALERARIPEYLGSENHARANFILNYEDWDSIDHWARATGGAAATDPTVHVHTFQDARLWVPMHRAFYADDTASLSADVTIENHYPLYLVDMDW